MPSVNLEIAPSVIQWIMGQKQYENIGSDWLEKISLWKSGAEQPTFTQIEKVSKVLNVPLGYFFLQKPPQEDLSLLEYRTVDSLSNQEPSRNLIDTHERPNGNLNTKNKTSRPKIPDVGNEFNVKCENYTQKLAPASIGAGALLLSYVNLHSVSHSNSGLIYLFPVSFSIL